MLHIGCHLSASKGYYAMVYGLTFTMKKLVDMKM